MALPATAPPVILARNVFDIVQQHPQGVVSANGEAAGNPARKVTNYRRDRPGNFWQAPSDGGGLGTWGFQVDLGAGNTAAIDSIFIDRGSNLFGRSILVYSGAVAGAADEYLINAVAPAQPALGTGTGDPTTGFAVTEEGALYYFKPAPTAAYRHHHVYIGAAVGFIPRVTGIILGLRHQLLNYSRSFDDDAGERKSPREESDFGMRASGRTVSWHTLNLSLSLIGQTEYDTSIRSLRKLLFDRDVPYVAWPNYGVYPYKGRMYRFDGTRWSMAAQRYYREGVIPGREEYPLLPAP